MGGGGDYCFRTLGRQYHIQILPKLHGSNWSQQNTCAKDPNGGGGGGGSFGALANPCQPTHPPTHPPTSAYFPQSGVRRKSMLTM